MERTKVTLSLESDVIDIIDANSTARTKADFVGVCVRAYVESLSKPDAGILESIAASVRRIEKRLEGMG